MNWKIEDSNGSGGKELTDDTNSYPLTNTDIETLKSGKKAAVKELVNKKRLGVGSEPNDEDLDGIRKAVGGDPFQKNAQITPIGRP